MKILLSILAVVGICNLAQAETEIVHAVSSSPASAVIVSSYASVALPPFSERMKNVEAIQYCNVSSSNTVFRRSQDAAVNTNGMPLFANSCMTISLKPALQAIVTYYFQTQLTQEPTSIRYEQLGPAGGRVND